MANPELLGFHISIAVHSNVKHCSPFSSSWTGSGTVLNVMDWICCNAESLPTVRSTNHSAVLLTCSPPTVCRATLHAVAAAQNLRYKACWDSRLLTQPPRVLGYLRTPQWNGKHWSKQGPFFSTQPS